jgi:alpha-ribazole phosphatase
MKNYNIMLLRHGETEANERGLYIGKTDMLLSEAGIKGLELMREKFYYPTPEKLYTSPLRRAVESARILFPDYPHEDITVVPELREMDFGIFEGLAALDIRELDTYKSWLAGGFDAAPPGGESARDVLSRCLSALDLIISDVMEHDYSDSVIVTHSGIITDIICAFGLPKFNPRDIVPGFGTGYLISVSAQLWQTARTFEIVGQVPGSH